MKKGENRPEPKENQIYKHFKGTLYQVVAIAVHTEDSERLVVYRSVDEPTKVFARPLEMFMSEIDRFRYPLIRAKYRFTLVAEECEGTDVEETISDSEDTESSVEDEIQTSDSNIDSESVKVQEEDGDAESEDVIPQALDKNEQIADENVEITDDNAVYKEDGTLVIDPLVEKILDEKDFTKKIEGFQLLRGKCTDEMLTTLAISLDVQLSGNSVEEKYAEILKTLRMHEKYESGRLR